MRKTICFVSLIVCLALATVLLIWTAKSNGPLLAQTTPPVSTRVMVIDLPSTTARVATDLGVQSSVFKGQIALLQSISSTGQVLFKMESFNFIGSQVRTRRGWSGTLGLTLKRGSAVTQEFSPSTGSLRIGMEAVFHYGLIDRIKGYLPSKSDDIGVLTERMKGQYSAQFTLPFIPQTTSNPINGNAMLALSEPVLGAIQGIGLDFPPSFGMSLLPGPCQLGLRTISIQPIFIRSDANDPAPTGRAFDTFMDQSLAIWDKACVSLEFREAIFIEDDRYKRLTVTELGDLADLALNRAGDAVPVVVVEAHTRALGSGGTTRGGGTERAVCIVSDDNIDITNDHPTPSNNVLAHELGHALGLCHPSVCDPDNQCEEPKVLGSKGSVMNNSGFALDNPDLQSLLNASSVGNPRLVLLATPCCVAVDCRINCGDCTQEQ